MVKRLSPDRCFGLVIDVQDFFLSQLNKPLRTKIETGTAHFAALLTHLRIPIVATIERPVRQKGFLPEKIARTRCFEKDFFDLTREKDIRDHLRSLKKKQAVVAGCETDVCVLESCLGLRSLGFEVFAVEDLLFSSSRDTGAAVSRMKAEGVVFLSYKTLFHELLAAQERSEHRQKLGPLPVGLPDAL